MDKKLAESILSIFKDCIFDGELTEYSFEEKILKHLPEDFDYDYYYGATKIVFILPDKNFVIKIPFSGCYVDKEIETKAEKGAKYKWISSYSKFTGAQSPMMTEGDEWDYCQVECDIYALAEEEAVEDFFAKTECIGFIHNYPIYVQEIAKIYKDIYPFRETEETEYRKKYTEEDYEKIDSLCYNHNYDYFNKYWLCDAFKYYGEIRGEEFLQFIKNVRVEDLHKANIGYIGDRPVIIDYSGFNN